MKAEATIASSTLDLACGKTAVQRGKNIESRLAPQWGSRVFVFCRRPHTLIHAAAGAARLRHTWVKSVLVSEPRQGVERACETLSKRLGLAGCRNVGGRLFEATPVEAAAAILRDLYPDMQALPPEPVEHVIPMFLRKETPMFNEAPAQPAGLPTLIVANTAIQQDREGRYCLNDLHRAAGGEKRHQPSNWLRSDQTKELIEELKAEITDPQIRGTAKNQPVTTYQGGNDIQGTYACKELVYAYAMWISPKFNLMVIRAFDALVTGRKPEVGATEAHPEIARAARMTAWRIANEMRVAYLDAMGTAKRPEDEERAWEMFAVQMERIEERLLAKGREMIRKHSPQVVAAWIMAWRPEKPALV